MPPPPTPPSPHPLPRGLKARRPQCTVHYTLHVHVNGAGTSRPVSRTTAYRSRRYAYLSSCSAACGTRTGLRGGLAAKAPPTRHTTRAPSIALCSVTQAAQRETSLRLASPASSLAGLLQLPLANPQARLPHRDACLRGADGAGGRAGGRARRGGQWHCAARPRGGRDGGLRPGDAGRLLRGDATDHKGWAPPRGSRGYHTTI